MTEGSTSAGSDWTAGRVIGLVFASIGGLIGLAVLVGGVAVMAAFAVGRDGDGYFTTDSVRLDSGTYAITSQDIDLGADEVDWAPDKLLGNLRVQVEGDRPVFVGIGRDDDVERYLRGVRHDELIDFHGDEPEFDRREGRRRPPTPPGDQAFWVTRAEGEGEQSLTWDAEFGRWTIVVMNADAGRPIAVEADAGLKIGWAIWAGLGALLLGLVMTAGAVVTIVIIGRRAERG